MTENAITLIPSVAPLVKMIVSGSKQFVVVAPTAIEAARRAAATSALARRPVLWVLEGLPIMCSMACNKQETNMEIFGLL